MIADGVYVMSRPRAVGFAYAPLLLCSFRPDLTQRLVEAQRLYRQYPSYADADTAAARLRWCRLRAGLLQREVAAAVGIADACYTDLEHGKPDRLPAGLVDRLAAFYGIPADDLLDNYNRFLYRGPAQQLRAWKEQSGLTWEAFCRQTGIPSASLSAWLRGKKCVSRASWEKYFKGNIE